MRIRALALIATAITVPGVFVAAATAAPTDPAPSSPPHVLQIVLENHDYNQIIGNTAEAPFLNNLASTYGLATNWSNLSHPSEPNYLGLLTGSIQDNPQDRNPSDGTYSGPSFVDQLAQKGVSWKAYLEDMPQACDTTDTQGPGNYNVIHNPFMYLDSVRNNPAQCNRVVPFDQFTSDLTGNTAPDYMWVTPNMQHDMHDGSIQQGDSWVQQQMQTVFASQWYAQGGVVMITWDEGEPGDHIPAIVVSAKTQHAQQTAAGDHYGTLRTLENVYGVPPLGGAASAKADLMPLLGGLAPAPAPTGSAAPPAAGTPSASGTPSPAQPSATPTGKHKQHKNRKHHRDGTPAPPPPSTADPVSTTPPSTTTAGTTGGTPSSSAPPPPASPSGPWSLAGSDNFSGSGVDTAKWGMYSGNSGSNKWNPANCVEGGGELKVLGTGDGSTCGLSWQGDQTFGAWEVHAKFDAPASGQFDTTFIAWPQDDSQWQNAEMDYVEETDPARQSVDGFLHCTACSGGQLEAGPDPLDMTQWHTYRLEWTPNSVTYLVDGKSRFTTTDPAAVSQIPHHGTIQTDYNPDGTSPTPTTVHVNSFKVFTYTP